jgi:hypothetical protein
MGAAIVVGLLGAMTLQQIAYRRNKIYPEKTNRQPYQDHAYVSSYNRFEFAGPDKQDYGVYGIPKQYQYGPTGTKIKTYGKSGDLNAKFYRKEESESAANVEAPIEIKFKESMNQNYKVVHPKLPDSSASYAVWNSLTDQQKAAARYPTWEQMKASNGF